MNETVTITMTNGKDGKDYYFSSTGDADPNSPYPISTKRISKNEFFRLSRRKNNFDKEYNQSKEIIKFKYIDDRLEKWGKQNQRTAERRKEFEMKNKKSGCAGLFIFGITAFIVLSISLLLIN